MEGGPDLDGAEVVDGAELGEGLLIGLGKVVRDCDVGLGAARAGVVVVVGPVSRAAASRMATVGSALTRLTELVELVLLDGTRLRSPTADATKQTTTEDLHVRTTRIS